MAQMAAVLAQEMHFTAHEVEGMYFAGLLHDIGKILVDREILTKSGALDLTEYAAMSAHTRFGAEILSHIQFPWEHLTHTILHHHDRPAYDEFSPRRPRRNLDLSHKIIGLVDAFDAMSSDRPYRRALPFKACLNELVHGLSVQFDPEITREFLRAMLRDVERPPVQRRLLTDRFVRGDEKIVRHQIADALLRVEQFMGIITAY
ncbi:MAG: HD domain-containing protein [Candidatus Sumerlaeia bacterium]|nr:HD domain-containing protein [Candidatus Sumerlaeia bacterium]